MRLRTARRQIISSVPLLDELHDDLFRKKFAAQLAEQAMDAADRFEGYAALVQLVVPAVVGPVIVTDPDDDMVLAPAVAGGSPPARWHLRVSGTIARPPESERVRAQAKRPPLRRGKAGVPAATSWGLVHRALSSQAAHPLGNGRRSASGRDFLWGDEAVVAQRAENEASVVAASSALDRATPRPVSRNEKRPAVSSNFKNVLMTSHEQDLACSAVADAQRRTLHSHITTKLGSNRPPPNSVHSTAIVERPWRKDGNRMKRPEIQEFLITRDQAIGVAGNGSTENRQIVGVTYGVGGNRRGGDDVATSPEFRDGCVDLVGGAIEPAQAMLDKLAQDVFGQNQLYRRRQETVSQQLLANAREERCRQQHVGVEDHPHEMASRMSSSPRRPTASARDWSRSRFWRHRATARARSRMSSATSSAERHCLRPNSSSVWPESSGSLIVSSRVISGG